jgi:arylsulfatase A-like enzyme
MPGFVQSRSPLDHRGYGLELPPDVPTIAQHLSNAGVSCAGWHSNIYTGEQYGFDRGYDCYWDLGAESGGSEAGGASWREIAKKIGEILRIRATADSIFEQIKRHGFADANPKVRAERLVDGALNWLPTRTDDTSRFGYLHLMDTHLPYFPPSDYQEQINDAPTAPKRVYDLWKTLIENPKDLSEADVVALRALYEAEARYVDDQIERLIAQLRERGLWESTALVFTADHGELFRDREVPSNDNFKQPDYLCEELTHTPLVVGGTSIPAAQLDSLTSGLDVAPTISRLFGIAPATEWEGTPIDSVDREYIISALAHAYGDGTGARVEQEATHVAVRDENIALLWWLSDNYDTECYRRGPDGENRVDCESTECFELALEQAREHAETHTVVSEHGQTGNDVSKRLRDLGYIQ